MHTWSRAARALKIVSEGTRAERDGEHMRRRGPSYAPGLALLLLCCALVGGCMSALEADAAAAESQYQDGAAPCLETKLPASGSRPTKLGYSADAVLAYVQGEHTAPMTWASTGFATRLRMKVSGARVFTVESRINPAWDPAQGSRYCVNRMQVEASIALTTDDGQLNEQTDRLVLRSNGVDEVYGGFEVAADKLRGTYKPVFRQVVCYQRLVIKVLFAVDGIHGTLTDDVRAGACGRDTARELMLASARWGSRWLNY